MLKYWGDVKIPPAKMPGGPEEGGDMGTCPMPQVKK